MKTEMYNGEYVAGINKDMSLNIVTGEIESSKLMNGNGFPLPFVQDAKYTGTMRGACSKISLGKPYQATAELKNLLYHAIEGCDPCIVYKNDWKAWGH